MKKLIIIFFLQVISLDVVYGQETNSSFFEISADEATKQLLESGEIQTTKPLIKIINQNRSENESIQENRTNVQTEAKLNFNEIPKIRVNDGSEYAQSAYFVFNSLYFSINEEFGIDNSVKLLAKNYSLTEREAENFVDYLNDKMSKYNRKKIDILRAACLEYLNSSKSIEGVDSLFTSYLDSTRNNLRIEFGDTEILNDQNIPNPLKSLMNEQINSEANNIYTTNIDDINPDWAKGGQFEVICKNI